MKIVNIFILIVCMYNIGTCQIIAKSELLKVSKEDLGISTEEQIDNPNMFSFNKYQTYNLDEFATSLPFDDLSRYTLFLVIQQDKAGEFAMIHSDKKALNISSEYIEGVIKRPVNMAIGKPHILMYKGSSGRDIKKKILDPSVQLVSETRSEDFENQIHIADLIIYDKILNKKEIKVQESALSMQYSISIPQDSSYFDSFGNIVFDGSKHSPFNYRVTAVGLDEAIHFDKVKSKNTDPESILIGSIKKQNNNGHIFWADNNMPVEFEDNTLKRVWKLTQPSSTNENIDLSFDLKQLEINTGLFDYSLIVSDNSKLKDSESHPLTINGDQFYVNLDISSEQYFSIEKTEKSNIDKTGIALNFPNPSKIELKTPITLSSIKDLEGMLSIHTASGQQVLTKRVSLTENLNHIEEVKFQMSGLYFISFSNDKVTLTSKIFIL